MGIVGLTRFMSERSDVYLKPHKLKDSYIVVDGNNILCQMFQWHTKTVCAFGGDYDVFYYTVKDFFLNLQKCGVVPIVITDGGYERKKLKTIHRRYEDRMLLLRNFSRECWSGVFFPLLLQDVFLDVLEELKITRAQCFFEADSELAAVARCLNCPVLSYDSDFYIYDVMYIPFNTMEIRSKETEEPGSKFYMECSIYDTTNFLNVQGIERSLLPIVAALLGNDYADGNIFDNFINHVIIPHNSRASYNQRKIHGVMNWLRGETLESAKKLILSHLPKNCMERALQIINATFEDYKRASPSILPLLQIQNECNPGKVIESSDNDLIFMEDKELILKLPDKFVELFQSCKLSSFMMDIMHLNRYYLCLQVEDVNQPSSQLISIPIISVIHKILDSLIGSSTSLDLYSKVSHRYTRMRLDHDTKKYFIGMNMENVLKEPNVVKQNFFARVLDMDENDINVVKAFNNDWVLFIMSLMYWIKKSPQLSSSHVHAVLLMALANYIQMHVGYYKSYISFMKYKAGTMNRLSKAAVDVVKSSHCLFSQCLADILEIEYLMFTRQFIKLRSASDEVTRNGYFITTIHLFASFQSCIFHISQLNNLLVFPFLELKVAKFYSGTFLYNIYYLLNGKSNPLAFIRGLLKDTPNILNVYMFLVDKLSKYMPPTGAVDRPIRLVQHKGRGGGSRRGRR